MLIFLIIGLYFFLFKRLRRYLRYLQQDDYDARRFLHWVVSSRAFDTRGSLIACGGIFLEILGISALFFLGTCYFILALLEKNPEFYGKKLFIKTERTKRILFTALALEFIVGVPLLLSTTFFSVSVLILCQAAPLFLALAVFLLSFDEKKRQKKLFRKAHRRFLEVNPHVIAITGSYGKTTTKHFLGKLLNITIGPTFYPGKGVNTPMGITREIREHLRDKTPYAVIEMAAYGQGSINRLCKLTPPHGAILTTIGLAHLERFGSVESICKAKSELAESVPSSGFLVLNGDDPYCRQIGKKYPKKTMIYYGFNEGLPLDLKLSVGLSDASGTELFLDWQGVRYKCRVPVFGKPLLANLGAAFAVACHLGADPSFAASALSNLGTVDNRLQVKSDGNNIYLHDAYNSNPSGFESALEVLKAMPGKRRILMTPGMIELGPLQYSENERVAELASKTVDIALIVGGVNRQALEGGLLKGGLKKQALHNFKTREEAFVFLKSINLPGDVVLIENDLPDLYENHEVF